MNLVAEWRAHLHLNFNDEPLVTDVRVGVFYTAQISRREGNFFERAAEKACIIDSSIDSLARREGARDSDRQSRSMRSASASSGTRDGD
ncbi:MAG: hypothetical protein WA740_13100 [Candidatus Binataceae bacterium]